MHAMKWGGAPEKRAGRKRDPQDSSERSSGLDSAEQNRDTQRRSNRESREPGIGERVEVFLVSVFTFLAKQAGNAD